MDANKIYLFQFVNRDVHPDDEMFKVAKILMPETGKAFHYYFFSGGLLASRVQEYLFRQGKIPAHLSLLDFACGYGRITRYFALMFGKVTCADLEPNMIEFARNKFRIDGFLSNTDLANLQLPHCKFDVVFSFSLFTHLNSKIWASWFWSLVDCVAAGGYFIFSTRSPDFARKKSEVFNDDDKIAFSLKNETGGRLDPSIYGQTTVTRDFVKDVAGQKPGVLEYAAYFPGGAFDLYQDVHIFKRLPE